MDFQIIKGILFLGILLSPQVKSDDYFVCRSIESALVLGGSGEVNSNTRSPARGKAGPKGSKGAHGPPGLPGALGPAGVSGPKGETGHSGQKGESGNDCNMDRLLALEEKVNLLEQRIACLSLRFTISPSALTWEGGRDYCRSIGGELATTGINTLAKRAKIGESLNLGSGVYWIGARDTGDGNDWVWVDGSTVEDKDIHWYTKRNYPEPNDDSRGVGDCAEISRSRSWLSNDRTCAFTTLAICQIDTKC